MTDIKLIDYFNNNQNRNGIYKWLHYFNIYEKHFRPFVDKKIKVLEIGIWQGGSLKMWKEYFGENAEIVGIDINPKTKKFEEERIEIYIGDQADRSFLNNLIQKKGGFDIIIDDGGHYMNQQITSFKELYPILNEGGVYLCEDLHTSYWSNFDGGLNEPNTFIEMVKHLIDEMHGFHISDSHVTNFTKNTIGMHIYDSIVVFDKQNRNAPIQQYIGIGTI